MCPVAFQFAQDKRKMIKQARDSLVKAARLIKKYANQNMRDVESQVGDRVMLKLTAHIWEKIGSKIVHCGLVQKYDGPFEIIKRVGKVVYWLKLPNCL